MCEKTSLFESVMERKQTYLGNKEFRLTTIELVASGSPKKEVKFVDILYESPDDSGYGKG